MHGLFSGSQLLYCKKIQLAKASPSARPAVGTGVEWSAGRGSALGCHGGALAGANRQGSEEGHRHVVFSL